MLLSHTFIYNYYAFGATIVSNTYSNGKGVITFVGDVTEIGGSAFANCNSLTSVTIPDSVTTIGDNAFEYCSSLTSVTIPDSVTTIGSLAFLSCDSLAEFKGKFADDNGRILVVDGILIASAPAGLTEYTIPDSVTTIGYGAFACCESLTSVTIPDSVTTIGFCAFQACTSLTSITIPESVTSIGAYAFQTCTNLTSVYCKAIAPPVLEGDIFRFCKGYVIFVPAESVEAYKSASLWSKYASSIVGYDF